MNKEILLFGNFVKKHARKIDIYIEIVIAQRFILSFSEHLILGFLFIVK